MNKTLKQYMVFILCGKQRYRLVFRSYDDVDEVQKGYEGQNESVQADGVTFSLMDDIVAVEVRHGEFTLPDKYKDVYIDADTIWDWFDVSSPISEDEFNSLMDNRNDGLNRIKYVSDQILRKQSEYDGLLLGLENGGWAF